MSRIMQGMTKILDGVRVFQKHVFGAKEDLFRRLGKGQSPLVLFITCSDSRINPNLLTQTEPGELFILRNAGNIVPPYGAGGGGEDATIEYAVVALQVQHIVVCGHSGCGAMRGLLEPSSLETLPAVARWLTHARAVVPKVPEAGHKPEAPARESCTEERLRLAIAENALLQREHLKTHPAVAAAVAAGKLQLHAWVYHFESGDVEAHDDAGGRFVPLAECHQRPGGKAPAEGPPRQFI
jgi:carbonic anhydrase